MMYASRTPRDLNHDPLPYEGLSGGRGMAPYVDHGVRARYMPRPEFDHVQHNEPNPILATLRRHVELGADLRQQAQVFLNTEPAQWWKHFGVETVTFRHITHARAVLTRLANLTEKEQA